MHYQLKINGKSQSVEAEPGTPLLWVIRDGLNLTGTKYGCGVAACGACTVHLNGTPVRACSLMIEAVADNEITTIEGVNGRVANAVQRAWLEKDVVQCGYCQSGQVMSAIGLLQQNQKPKDGDIDAFMFGNVCRCATYVRVKDAIKLASSLLEA